MVTLEPRFGHFRDNVGVIARNNFPFLAIDIEFCVEVLPLPPMRYEPVETGSRVIIVFAHVPFADVGGVIPQLLQHSRETLQILWIFCEVIHHTMSMRVETTEDAGTAGRTQRCRTEGVPKVHPLVGKPVDVRCLQGRVTSNAHGIRSLIVSEQKQDVRAYAVGRSSC